MSKWLYIWMAAIKITHVPVSVSGEDEDGTALLINEGAE